MPSAQQDLRESQRNCDVRALHLRHADSDFSEHGMGRLPEPARPMTRSRSLELLNRRRPTGQLPGATNRYDGPRDSYDGPKDSYDGPAGGYDRGGDRYDGPTGGYDGPERTPRSGRPF